MAKSPSKKSSRRNREAAFEESTGTQRFPVRQKSAKLRAEESWNRNNAKPLVCRSDAQRNYLELINSNQIVIGVGPAGTGKTFLPVKFAAQQLDASRIKRIIVVRPIIEAGGGLGFLPGDEADKTAPYKVPFLEVLEEHYGKAALEAKLNGAHPSIVFVPPEFIRGRTFNDAFVILDEAQNMTCDQMKTFLTRLGEDTQCVIQGDIDQVDIKEPSGLVEAMEVLGGLDSVGIMEFAEEDIVRSGICKAILLRYRRHRAAKEALEAEQGKPAVKGKGKR